MRIPVPVVARGVRVAVIALVVAGCSVVGATAGATRPPTTEGTTSPSHEPGGTPPVGAAASGSATSFYLRSWTGPSADPKATFTWPAVLTVADGIVYDGRVAVPAIYPGPLLVTPFARAISQHGVDAIVAEARKQGLLGAKTDFNAPSVPGSAGAVSGAANVPGSRASAPPETGSPVAPETAHLTIVVEGVRHDLVGDTTAFLRCRCIPDAGTPAAFAAFWQRLESLDGWLGADLGPAKSMTIERLAVLQVTPEQPAAGIDPSETPWPLAAELSAFGTATGTTRCDVVSGADLAALLPVVEKSNALTRFVDASGAKRSLVVRVLTPGEPSPCGG